jgi:hypothetical protein
MSWLQWKDDDCGREDASIVDSARYADVELVQRTLAHFDLSVTCRLDA